MPPAADETRADETRADETRAGLGDVPLTHVHKWGCGWTKDCYALGAWEDGAADGDPGVWTTSPLSPADGVSL